jgi:calcineurin-like phosphoesterase
MKLTKDYLCSLYNKCNEKYFDGQLSAVIGTHTHVQTVDNQVFEKGTDYISDVGYCGAYDSVLGVCNKDAIAFSKNQDFSSHKPADGQELEFSAVLLDIDEESGKTKSIKRIYIVPGKEEITLYD